MDEVAVTAWLAYLRAHAGTMKVSRLAVRTIKLMDNAEAIESLSNLLQAYGKRVIELSKGQQQEG